MHKWVLGDDELAAVRETESLEARGVYVGRAAERGELDAILVEADGVQAAILCLVLAGERLACRLVGRERARQLVVLVVETRAATDSRSTGRGHGLAQALEMRGEALTLDVGEAVEAVLVEGLVHERVLLGRLHEILSARANAADEAVDVDARLALDLLEHRVQRDVGAGASHPSATMHHNRVVVGQVGGVHVAYQMQNADRIGARRVLVRPLGIVVLGDFEKTLLLLLLASHRHGAGRRGDQVLAKSVGRCGGGGSGQMNEVEGALEVVAAALLIAPRDLVVAVAFGHVEALGPVLGAALDALLHQLGEHDHGAHAVLPAHVPEVDERLALRTLRRDELVLMRVALHEVGVDVVGGGRGVV